MRMWYGFDDKKRLNGYGIQIPNNFSNKYPQFLVLNVMPMPNAIFPFINKYTSTHIRA